MPSRSNDRDHINEQGASLVSFTHEQNGICSQEQLNDIVHEHTIVNEKEETFASNDKVSC